MKSVDIRLSPICFYFEKKNKHLMGEISLFPGCEPLDGFHCQTNSLAKIFRFYKHPLSEDMLLGLGAGMGFFYWHQKGTLPFLGGRTNLKSFFSDIGKRTSVDIQVKTSSSEIQAEKCLLNFMHEQVPVMVFGDMAYLPWFSFPEEYHFGAHTFVVSGYNANGTFLATDMDPRTSGLKKGIVNSISISELRKARNSPFKPFPPHNAWLEFDFSHFRFPSEVEFHEAIRQTATAMLNPPITNAGIKGFLRTAKEMDKWQSQFSEKQLKLVLFNIYIFIEVGGTGGGCFRNMYSRFLKEVSVITSNNALGEIAAMISESGRIFTEMGMLFKNTEDSKNIDLLIKEAKNKLKRIYDIEEKAYKTIIQLI